MKGRRVFAVKAVARSEADKALKREKQSKQWMHLLNIGLPKESSNLWSKLGSKEQQLVRKSRKERAFQLKNSNYTLNPERICVRNLPRELDANDLRDRICEILIGGDVNQVTPCPWYWRETRECVL